jgi:hypothetical protein
VDSFRATSNPCHLPALPGKNAPAAFLESWARRRALLWQWDRLRNCRLVGIESGILSLHRLPILRSLPESFRYFFIGGSQSINNG